LAAEGKSSLSVGRGRSIAFNTHIEVLVGAGSIPSIEWNFEDTGSFVRKGFGKGNHSIDMVISTRLDRAV
jgi:hypothetical protein